MIILKKWQLLTVFLVNAIVLNTFSSPYMSYKFFKIKKVYKILTNQQNLQQNNTSKVQDELNKAQKTGKAVFLVVTGTGVTDIDKATAIAKKANGIYKNSVIIQMNRDDVANSELVTKWRLSGAPLPLILVISPKGYPTGGFYVNDATAEKIAGLVPSPKMEKVYESLSNAKPVLLVISEKSYTDRAKIIENCKLASTQLQNKVSIIEIDLSDSKEARFIKQLNLKNKPNTTCVLVINALGQTTGYFEGNVETQQLVIAAKKVIRSCCGSGSSSGSCSPVK